MRRSLNWRRFRRGFLNTTEILVIAFIIITVIAGLWYYYSQQLYNVATQPKKTLDITDAEAYLITSASSKAVTMTVKVINLGTADLTIESIGFKAVDRTGSVKTCFETRNIVLHAGEVKVISTTLSESNCDVITDLNVGDDIAVFAKADDGSLVSKPVELKSPA